MMLSVFEIDFSRLEILFLTLIPVIINIGIFLYVSLFIRRTLTTSYFSLFVFALGLWQISEGFMKMSLSIETAMFWNRISQIVVTLVVLFGLFFSVFFTKLDKKISWNILFSVLVFPVLFFFFCIESNLVEYTAKSSAYWYWIVNPIPTIFTTSYLLWVSIGGIIMELLFLMNYFKKDKTCSEQKQALLLLIGFSIPILFGILMEVAFPLIFNIDEIPLTANLTTVFSLTAFIAIKKYFMLDFSPKYHWDKIVSSINEGILIVDNKGEIKYANDAFCKLFGYDFSEIVEKNAAALFGGGNIEKDKMKERNNEQHGNKSGHYESLLKTKSGEEKWFLIGASPYTDLYGSVIGSIGIHADINDRKIAEEKLIATNSELEIFIYKASHDLGGPLASIIGLVNVSKAEIVDELSSKYLEMIGTSTKKLDYTLKELVKTMKIKDTERFDDLIDFNELFETKLSEFKYFDGFDKIKITTSVSVNKAFFSNAFLLQTIIQNLIENSLKYRNKMEPESYLNIYVDDYLDGIKIVIKDNGIGIEPSLHGLIFNMYFKGVASSNGSGLGLYLVKKCVEKLNGAIVLKSLLGKGTEFTILLGQRK